MSKPQALPVAISLLALVVSVATLFYNVILQVHDICVVTSPWRSFLSMPKVILLSGESKRPSSLMRATAALQPEKQGWSSGRQAPAR